MFYTQIPTYCTFNTEWLIWVLSFDVFIVNKRHFTTFCQLEGQHKGLVIMLYLPRGPSTLMMWTLSLANGCKASFIPHLSTSVIFFKLCVLCVFSGFRGPCGGEIFPGGGGSGGAEYTGWCRWSRKVSEQTARHIQRHPDRLQWGCLFCTLPLQHSFTLAQRTFWQDCCVIFTLFAQI